MSAAEKIYPDVMDLVTAAEYLGFHPVTLREWKREGDGPPGRKIGRRWRCHKPSLDAYIVGSKPSSWPAAPTVSTPAASQEFSGSGSRRQVASAYSKALGLQTERSPRNGRRSSTRNTTKSRA